MTQNSRTNKPVLDKYKESLQPMVDEALAVQNLAPAMQEAITQNKPLNDKIQEIAIEAVQTNSKMKKAVAEAAKENNIIEKSKVDYKQPGYWIPIVISSIIGLAAVIVAIIESVK